MDSPAAMRPGRASGLNRTRVARPGRTLVMAIAGTPSPALAHARLPRVNPGSERGARAASGRTPSRGGRTVRKLGATARIARTHSNHLLRLVSIRAQALNLHRLKD